MNSEKLLQVPKDKLLETLERALVDVVNKVGVDINRAVIEPYHALLLPFVAGLGPRKAQTLIQKINSMVRLYHVCDFRYLLIFF